MRANKLTPLAAAIAASLALSATPVSAGPYVSQGPFVVPIAGDGIPGPTQVPGKEYTDRLDKDDTGALLPMQSLMWDGAGGIGNSFNYGGVFTGFLGTVLQITDGEVDAQAHPIDALFDEVVADQAALLVSVQGDPIAPIMYHTRGADNGGIWATAADVDQHGVTDLNSLEVWGPEASDDGTRFSLVGDPGGVAVWDRTGPGTATALVSSAAIATAIGCTNEQVDLDALMMSGNRMMFSVMPSTPCGLDGGEIWTWDYVAGGPAAFLVHGGVTWDTAHNVTDGFGAENVDALEAVATQADIPVPGTLALLGLAGGLLGFFGRRRR